MATEEIEISELELAEDLAPDMVLPVETSTDTKATSLQKIKDWLGSFFISKTADEEFLGIKTMISQRLRFGKTNLGSFKEIEAISEKGGTRLGVLRFTNGSDGVSREASLNIVDNENANKGGLAVRVSQTGVVQTIASTPPSNSNSNEIATTKWVRENYKNNIIPNIESMVEIVTAISSTGGYIAPNSGFVSVQTNSNGVTTKLYVDRVVVAQAFQYSGDSHGHESKQLFTLVGKGQVVKTDRAVQFGVFVPFK